MLSPCKNVTFLFTNVCYAWCMENAYINCIIMSSLICHLLTTNIGLCTAVVILRRRVTSRTAIINCARHKRQPGAVAITVSAQFVYWIQRVTVTARNKCMARRCWWSSGKHAWLRCTRSHYLNSTDGSSVFVTKATTIYSLAVSIGRLSLPPFVGR